VFLAASFVSLAALLPVSAPELPQPTVIEIDRLLTTLGSSECRFNRNGTWYGGQEAQGHLRTKYDYLVRKKLIHGTEDFIVGAGEKSSMSGQAYQVQCPGQPPVPSAEWLRNRLSEIRRNAT
jgi:uncharacterized protein DUF5329